MMLPAKLPPSALLIHDVPVECINRAAVHYHIPAVLIISILQVENARRGTAHLNSDHSIDYGPMQINSLWLTPLKKYGITAKQLQFDPCVNVSVGSWILSRRIAGNKPDPRLLWKSVADYHSFSRKENRHYQYRVLKQYYRIMSFLNPSA